MATGNIGVSGVTANPAPKTNFLSTLKSRLASFFKKLAPIAQTITQDAALLEPIVDTALVSTGHAPAAALYNSVSSSVLNAETAAVAAGAGLTGAQKAAAVLSDSTVQSAFSTFEQAVGVQPHSTAQQLQYVNSVVTTLNNLNGTPVANA